MSWKITQLENLFDVGSAKRVLKAQWQSEGIPFYRGREITKLSSQGCVDNELFITEELYSEYKDKYGVPSAGDIMITAIGTIGNSYIVKEDDKFYYKDASVLCLKKTSDVDSRFIDYWLKSNNMRSQLSEGNGATVDTLTITKMKSLNIALPSLSEQKRIVAILDEAFAGIDQAIANTEKNLASARELFESYLNTIFTQKGEGWETKPLKGYCSDYKSAIVDGPFGSNLKKEHFVESGVPVLKIQNIKSYKIIDKKLNYVTEQKASELSRHAFKRGDIVMTKLGNPLGVSAIVENMDSGVIVADLVRVRADKINTEYLCYQLNSPVIKSFINSKQKGATRPRVKITIVRDLPIAAPSLKEQERIVDQINQISEQVKRIEDIYRQKLVSLNELKQSLLQKAFSGELTADMADETQAEAAA